MHRVDPLADLVAQSLQQELPLAACQGGAVHQQPGGLVNGHQVLVAMEYPQGVAHADGVARRVAERAAIVAARGGDVTHGTRAQRVGVGRAAWRRISTWENQVRSSAARARRRAASWLSSGESSSMQATTVTAPSR